MKLDMNFSFDTSVPNDGEVMQKVCAVLSGAPVETIGNDSASVNPVAVVPDEVVEKLKKQIKEVVEEQTDATQTTAPSTEEQANEPAATEVVIDPMTSTEEDMMKVGTDVLFKILKDLKVDPYATEGKNTNAKLRRHILDWRKTQTSAPATTEEDDEQDEAPAATTAKKMTYDEAKRELGPYFVNTKCSKYGTWREGCQAMMKEHGACVVNADGTKTPKLSALGDADYTPLVNAIKSFYKL